MRHCRTASLLFTLLCAGGFMIACAESGDPGTGIDMTDAPGADTPVQTNAADDDSYVFGETFGGTQFRILNTEDIYSMHAKIDPEEQNGETLNDAQFLTCRTLEEKLELTLTETNIHLDEIQAHINKILTAGDDVYDIIYMPTQFLNQNVTLGALYNLMDFDEFTFDREWWMQSYNEAITMNGALYAAEGYSHLMAIDSLNIMYCNEDMMENRGLEKPYSLVRNGAWTLDALHTYLKAAASMNSDTTFNWTSGGTALYGISLADAYQGIPFMLFGADERMLEMQDGVLTLTAGDARYFEVVSKLASILTKANGNTYYGICNADDGDDGHWIYAFEHERAMFMVTELCKTGRMRDKDYTYGILPLPKFDEAQEKYYTTTFNRNPLITIPVTAPDTHLAAAAADALTYLSYEMMYPVFRETTLEQKGLRNEESIEMLDLILQNSVPDFSAVYSIGINYNEQVRLEVQSGSDAVASILEKHRSEMEKAIEVINEQE